MGLLRNQHIGPTMSRNCVFTYSDKQWRPNIYVRLQPISYICRLPCMMSLVVHENEQSSGRQSSSEHSDSTATTSQHSENQSRRKAVAAYYDSLSKVWLTRGALAELNRRNKQKDSHANCSVARSLNLGDKPGWLRDCSDHLKSFAEDGGPDLRDIIGVSQVQEDFKKILISSL